MCVISIDLSDFGETNHSRCAGESIAEIWPRHMACALMATEGLAHDVEAGRECRIPKGLIMTARVGGQNGHRPAERITPSECETGLTSATRVRNARNARKLHESAVKPLKSFARVNVSAGRRGGRTENPSQGFGIAYLVVARSAPFRPQI